jgi:hypothetical protein
MECTAMKSEKPDVILNLQVPWVVGMDQQNGERDE